jgi:hypothetical protein
MDTANGAGSSYLAGASEFTPNCSFHHLFTLIIPLLSIFWPRVCVSLLFEFFIA